MLRMCALIACLVIMAGAAVARETPDTITCHVKVVDAKARPVAIG